MNFENAIRDSDRFPAEAAEFDGYLSRWSLIPDGEPFRTRSSRLMPVRYRDMPAMLKIAHEPEEKRGGSFMPWWGGDGAARVLAHEDGALLLERATGSRSLVAMAHDGRDDEASRIICAVAERLHAPRGKPLPEATDLRRWFAALPPGAEKYGGIVAQAWETAEHLLAAPEGDITVLHGDLHHGNVLDFESGGFLAIDPKGLIGDRGFDFAIIFCNPNFAVATAPGRLARQVEVVASAAHLDRKRLLQWILSHAGLSAAWILDDGDDAALDLAVAQIAANELNA